MYRWTILLACTLAACQPEEIYGTREEALTGAVAVDPADDVYPPILQPTFSDWFEDPVPLQGGINTAGAEDSPFVAPDDSGFYFFFTPDPTIEAQDQVTDTVTGIWYAPAQGDTWGEAQRVKLKDAGTDVLDGCPTALPGQLWFCSIRADNYRDVDMWIAECDGAECSGWRNAGERVNVELSAGELYITEDSASMLFGAELDGGQGGYDLWIADSSGDSWADPVNLGTPVNDAGTQYLPAFNHDGSELWWTGDSALGQPGPALYLSQWGGTAWGEPQEVVSSFAGEPSLDTAGNLYFTHHYFTEGPGEMIEADIYVTRRITP